ncbi:MAG TPA: IclR family transcriptional regulator [Phycisphaerae bacterium]|nr:IclR family transcriptional regulator [Phycisphaerae bacterium]HRY68388.1 IclR family transcriptional regulator [Phycisphaerae bacterium]HSA27805.1 IclR family transcriptional regulator [Phycisphaerae bacterium]
MSERLYDVPAARKAISLIELLCESPQPMGVSEISQRLELNKNMVFRLVRTLSDLGWIVADHDNVLKYRMTLQPFQHTSKPVSRLNVRVAAAEPLHHLWETTQQSCYLCILDQRRALCIEHLDATGDLRFAARVGGHYYLHASAPGKVLLAYSGDELLRQLGKADLPARTPKTITDKRALKEHLAAVVAAGYAVDDMENVDGVICLAVPIFGPDDKLVGTLGLSSLTFNYTTPQLVGELGPLVMEAGQATSRTMGASEERMTVGTRFVAVGTD